MSYIDLFRFQLPPSHSATLSLALTHWSIHSIPKKEIYWLLTRILQKFSPETFHNAFFLARHQSTLAPDVSPGGTQEPPGGSYRFCDLSHFPALTVCAITSNSVCIKSNMITHHPIPRFHILIPFHSHFSTNTTNHSDHSHFFHSNHSWTLNSHFN